jgi:peptide-methionine (S)-S-oxide reductase
VEKPTYAEVCTGATGHTEGLQLIYDPKAVSYETLCRKLLGTVNPTLRDRVGNDRGTQYRHGIYPHTDAQWQVAEQVNQKRKYLDFSKRSPAHTPESCRTHPTRDAHPSFHSHTPLPANEQVMKEAQVAYDKPIVTELKRAAIFWPAENYHQRYLEKGGQTAAKEAAEKVRCYG